MVAVQDSNPHFRQDVSPETLERGQLHETHSTVLTTSVRWVDNGPAVVPEISVASAREKLEQLLQARKLQERPTKCRSQPCQAAVHAGQQRSKAACALQAERCEASSQLAVAEAARKAADAEAAAAKAYRGQQMAVQRAQYAEAAAAALELELELNQVEADAAHEEMQYQRLLAEAAQLQAELNIVAIKQERDKLQERLRWMKRRHACSIVVTWSIAAVSGCVFAMAVSRNNFFMLLSASTF